MKKNLRLGCLILAVAVLLSLSVGVFAADSVTVSNQKLRIDGEEAPAVAYNVNGNNYFRLRDIAYLLNGTGASFSVGYDAASRSVTIVTGEAYEPVGGELDVLTGDPADVRKSPQTIYIDGWKAEGLSVYNIDGNNYFMLRDLGAANDCLVSSRSSFSSSLRCSPSPHMSSMIPGCLPAIRANPRIKISIPFTGVNRPMLRILDGTEA